MTRVMAQKSSRSLRTQMLLFTSPLAARFDLLWADTRPSDMVPSFLVLLHQIMRASVPTMESAVRRCQEIGSADPLARPLAAYYTHHIQEERDHDVWALEDLEAAGFDRDVALRQVPPPAVARLAGAQKYWVEHHHPVMLLGCIMVLESFPPSEEIIDQMRDRSGLPDKAFRTFRLHGALDPQHSADLFAFVDELPLTSYEVGMIGTSMSASIESLTECIAGLKPINWAA